MAKNSNKKSLISLEKRCLHGICGYSKRVMCSFLYLKYLNVMLQCVLLAIVQMLQTMSKIREHVDLDLHWYSRRLKETIQIALAFQKRGCPRSRNITG